MVKYEIKKRHCGADMVIQGGIIHETIETMDQLFTVVVPLSGNVPGAGGTG